MGFFLFQFAIPARFPIIAAELSAGFAPNSVWISRTNVTDGDSVNIFTVIYNSSDEGVTGELVFTIDGKTIGTKNFALLSGETKIESFPWTAEQGKHTVSAKIGKTLNTNTGATTALLYQTTTSVAVDILSPPPPSKTTKTLNLVASTLETAVSSSTPIILNALESLYNTTESFRTELKSSLEKQIEEEPQKEPEKQTEKLIENNGKAENTRTANSEQKTSSEIQSETTNNPEFLGAAQRQAAAVLLSVVSSKPLFYIALGLSFLFILFLLRTFIKSRRKRF